MGKSVWRAFSIFFFPTDLFSSCSLTVPRRNRRPSSSRVPPPTEDTSLHLLDTAIEQQHRGQHTASLTLPQKRPSPPPRTPALPTRSPQTPLPCLQGIRGITAASSTLAASAAASWRRAALLLPARHSSRLWTLFPPSRARSPAQAGQAPPPLPKVLGHYSQTCGLSVCRTLGSLFSTRAPGGPWFPMHNTIRTAGGAVSISTDFSSCKVLE